MPATNDYALIAATVLVYVLALWLPGLLVGWAAGLRGWLLAAAAPLISYIISGIFGPLSAKVGIAWSIWTFLGSTVVLTAVFLGLKALSARREKNNTPAKVTAHWGRGQQWVVIVGMAIAAIAGAAIVAAATGNLSHIPQDWDAALHANGVRYIANTGDGSLTGMASINWYDKPGGIFYPNAYHLIAAVVYTLTGAPIGVVLNAQTILLPAILAFGLIAVVRYFKGSPLTAVFSALVAVSSLSALYDMLWRGPLLPFATGNVLAPVFVLLTARFLDKTRLETGLLFALSAVGLLAVNPANLFSGIAFLVPLLISRWWGRGRQFAREIAWLAGAGVIGLLIAIPQLLGSLSSAESTPTFHWPIDFTASRAVGSLLTFQHYQDFPQYWLAVPLWIGLLYLRRLGELRWIAGTALLFGALFVVNASYDNKIVATLTRPWWNDQWRTIALASIPLALLAGHGLAQLCTGLARVFGATRTSDLEDVPPETNFRWRNVVAAALVLLAFAGLTQGFYYGLNSSIMAKQYGDGPAIDSGEYQAMERLGTLVKPGERVMNDRIDGTVWMYAVSGAHPVAGHYDQNQVGADPVLMARSFDEYDTDPAVRAAAKRLNIRYLIIGDGKIRPKYQRATGLRELNQVRELKLVFQNKDASIYQFNPQ